jgi:hypothetical protein
MDLKWKLYSSDTRGDLRCTVFAAKVPGGFVYWQQWTQLGRKATWLGQDEWDGGSADVVLKNRFGLTHEGCVLHTQEQLLETLQLVAA